MKIELITAPAAQWNADGLILPMPEDKENKSAVLPEGFAALAAALAWIDPAGIQPRLDPSPGALSLFHAPRKAPVSTLLAVGLGPDPDLDRIRQAVQAAFQAARKGKMKTLGLPLELFSGLKLKDHPGPAALAAECLFSGLGALYSFDELKKEKNKNAAFPERIVFFSDQSPDPGLEAALCRARAEAAGSAFVRDLVNRPPNLATPSFLAEQAVELGENFGFKVEILDQEEMSAMGMGCFEAVFKGSNEPAKMIVIDSSSENDDSRPIVFVGKGVTFDSGGISIKPASGMQEMKDDMAGGAAVLGYFKTRGEARSLGCGFDHPRVVGIVPCTENMPGGKAIKPGDVARSLKGKTVEIINTDAEGRLLLCDALALAERFSPRLTVDLATLTGACVVALGTKTAGLFADQDDLSQTIREIGQKVGEKLWPLPLWDSYFETLKSDVADMKNVGAREGGAIHAALFLKQFAPESGPWAHIDIAGPAYVSPKPGGKSGATGFGLRTLLRIPETFKD